MSIDQQATFEAGSKRMETAFAALQLSLADALDNPSLNPERREQGETLKALCKDLSEQSKVITDNYANALDRDNAKQDTSKLEFRGQLQESLARFATVVGQLDERAVATAKAWSIEPDRTTPTADIVPQAPIAVDTTKRATEQAEASAKDLTPAKGPARPNELHAGMSWAGVKIWTKAGALAVGTKQEVSLEITTVKDNRFIGIFHWRGGGCPIEGALEGNRIMWTGHGIVPYEGVLNATSIQGTCENGDFTLRLNVAE